VRVNIGRLRRLAESTFTDTILVLRGEGPTFDPYGGEVYGDQPEIVYQTKGAFHTGLSGDSLGVRQVTRAQRLEDKIVGIIEVPVSAGGKFTTSDRLYRVEAARTYEITGIRRTTSDFEVSIEVAVQQADPERSYEPNA
jgi:hypothetical protein